MQTQRKYGIIEAKEPEFPPISLLRVPHKNSELFVNYPAFGPAYYSNNTEEMQKFYSHPQTGEKISFREPTISESVSAAAHDFENLAKRQIFDPSFLQLGIILRTSQGVYVNMPRDEEGKLIEDEEVLKRLLDKSKEINGIYLCDNDFGFAPYETFKQGEQDCDEFTEGGLARVLEHTEEKKAQKLEIIASPEFYKRGVDVWGFDEVEKPVLKVVVLGSSRGFFIGRLNVGGYDWLDYLDGYGDDGYAFGGWYLAKPARKNLNQIY